MRSPVCFLGKEPILQHHRLLVLEAAPKIEPMVHAPQRYSNRVSAITPGTKKLLDGSYCEYLVVVFNIALLFIHHLSFSLVVHKCSAILNVSSFQSRYPQRITYFAAFMNG